MKSAFPQPDPGEAGERPFRKPPPSPTILAEKNRGVIFWRLVFLSVILLLTLFLREQERFFGFPFSFFPFYILISLQFFLSLIYLFFLLRGKAGKGLAVFQIGADGLFVTAVVYISGGVESLFSFLYFLIILAGGILFYRPGGLWTAAYAFACYTVLLMLQGSGWIPYAYGLPEKTPSVSLRYLFYLIVMNGIGFFFVGYLGSLLAEQTRRQQDQIERQKINIDRLERLNRLVVENLDMGLFSLDQARRILSVNPAGEKILKRSADELVQRPFGEVFPPSEGENGRAAGEEGQRKETRYRAPDGTTLIIGYTLYGVKGRTAPGSEMAAIVTFKDISKIKAMEEHLRQVDRLALMGKMAAGIAHEIRNPLASISGSLQVLKEVVQDQGTGERLVSIVSRELQKLDGLIHDFLAFSRPVQPPREPLNISELIEETVELIRKSREISPSIHWRVEVEPGLHGKIAGGELSQALWNLVTNALQAMGSEGEITIRSRGIRVPDEGDYLEIIVQDTGTGIREEDRQRIFEPFFTTKERGTGLGLSIVQKIVSDCGGRILLHSRPGEGSIFTLQFPMNKD